MGRAPGGEQFPPLESVWEQADGRGIMQCPGQQLTNLSLPHQDAGYSMGRAKCIRRMCSKTLILGSHLGHRKFLKLLFLTELKSVEGAPSGLKVSEFRKIIKHRFWLYSNHFPNTTMRFFRNNRGAHYGKYRHRQTICCEIL